MFASPSTTHDLVLLPRRAASESSEALLCSPTTVPGAPSSITPLSTSSSAQSALSFIVSSSSSHSATSSPKPTLLVSTKLDDSSMDSNRSECLSEDRDEDMNIGANTSAQQLLEETSTQPPLSPTSSHCDDNNPGIRPSLTSRSHSTSGHFALESQPPAPLYFGDYLFPENPSIQDLRHIFLLDKNSKQKDFRQSLQLHAHLMGLALTSRISRSLDLAYDQAHDAFKNKQRPDRRNEFISAFNYTHDETERILHHALAHPQPRASFLDMMNASSSNAILTFLHRLRTDPSILATAFRNLQSQELDALLVPERSTANQSVQTPTRGTRDRGHTIQVGSSHSSQYSSSSTQRVNQQQHQSQSTIPNFVNNQDIVHIILTTLFGPSSFEREHTLRLGTLTAIFVTLLSEKKGERAMTEILERYVVQSEWHQSSRVKARFERVLLDIIRRGELELSGFSDEELNANVLPATQQHQSFGRMELTGRQAIIEDFFTEACLDILDTLREFSPPCLLELSRHVFGELDHDAKSYGSLIIIVKFFFYRFMNKSIAYPETYGMMQDLFISERQRQRILFTTHQRLYRYVTSILNPVPGWENRSSFVDQRIRDKIENFVGLFSSPVESKEEHSSRYTLNPVAELSTPTPIPGKRPRGGSSTDGSNTPTVTPVLLLCPSDFTTLFYFVCPYLRTPSSSQSSAAMTRSSSFNGKSTIATRHRTSSETPPTYQAAMKAASSSATPIPAVSKISHPPSANRAHRRASPSFSLFSSAAASLPFKAKPPAPLTLERVLSAPAEPSPSGTSFLTLSGIKPGQVASPKTAAVEVTSSLGIAAASLNCDILSNSKGNGQQTTSSGSQSSLASRRTPEPTPKVVKHWNDEVLVPDLKSAIQELKRIQPGPVKEVPWALSNPNLSPLREPWALAYVQYSSGETGESTLGESMARGSHSHKDMDDMHSQRSLVEIGLALAPHCMAMSMENTAIGGEGSRLVTVTKPMLIDQVMDYANTNDILDSNVDLDAGEESDNQSLLSSEDGSLAQPIRVSSVKDKNISILRVNSSHMLSSTDASGTARISSYKENDTVHSRDDIYQEHLEDWAAAASRRTAVDRAWKARIRQTITSEADLPEDVRTVARSILKILREFDVTTVDENEFYHGEYTDNSGDYWNPTGDMTPGQVSHDSLRSILIHGIEQARLFGSHASAIGFHHALRVLESSPVLRQLDSSKILYLLAMPIKHRLDHRAKRARNRTVWEGFAHSWHLRLVSAVERKRELLSSLRIKMYYQICVRTSRAFERSLGVVVALSRLNRTALRKYLSAEEWERCYGALPGTSDVDCRASYHEYSSNTYGGDATGQQNENSRRYSANNSQPHALRTAKVRRSSFSAYFDNVASRSFGSSSLLETSLGHLKEKEQATFSNSYGSGYQNMLWSNSNSAQSSSAGSLNDLADIQSDFTMDSREVKAVRHWITEAGIHNFLPGEDNFLRFCMEVESVIRGIGLGGTGIQGAGIPQAQNGAILPTLSSSGSDFFIKEVAKYNGQFVAGMGPTEQAAPVKSSTASGVAEFLVNSLKHGHAASSLPSTGSHMFSHASSSASSLHNASSDNSSLLSQQTTSRSSITGRTRVTSRLTNNHQLTQEPIPILSDDPSSIYSFPTGPTYALYNPPYSTTSHGSSSYSGSLAPGGVSSTVSPHQISHLPKDMTEFLRRIQIKLTSFVLSEWLDLFGEVESDRWFVEFMEEMELQNCQENMHDKNDPIVPVDTNQDGYMPLNEMDGRDKPHCESEPYPASGFTDPRKSVGSDSRVTGSISGNWNRHEEYNSTWLDHQPSSQKQRRQSGFEPQAAEHSDADTAMKPSVSAPTFSTTRSVKTTHSLGSIFSTAPMDNQYEDEEYRSSHTRASRENSFTASSRQYATDAQGNLRSAGENLLNARVNNITRNGPPRPNPSKPYDLADAYRSTIEQFNNATSPYQKLGHLYALELLIVAAISYPDSCNNSLDYLNGLKRSARSNASEDAPPSPRTFTPGTDAIVNEIENLFRRPGVLGTRHLLRDMQLIATFIPGSILDLRDDGKAFWDIALAISSLKSNVVEYIVQKGTRYVEVEESSRTSQEMNRDGARSIMEDDDEHARMAEAVRLFTIGAKESNPVAQRELAILYMSLPVLPSPSPPSTGHHRGDGSPHIGPTARMPSPISITTSKYNKGPARTNTPPPPSPMGATSTYSNSLLGKSSTASIPIKQRSRHQHSSSSSGSSFGSGVLSGLGIMTGLGSFTASSSVGSGGSNDAPNNSSTASLQQLQHQLQQQHPGEFAEGYRDVDHVEVHSARQSTSLCSCTSSSHPHPSHQHRSHQQHQHHGHQSTTSAVSEPDKFNPENIAAAMHWFTLAAAQGDKFSINYLKHKESAGGLLGSMG